MAIYDTDNPITLLVLIVVYTGIVAIIAGAVVYVLMNGKLLRILHEERKIQAEDERKLRDALGRIHEDRILYGSQGLGSQGAALYANGGRHVDGGDN